jgi:hypothetical protein
MTLVFYNSPLTIPHILILEILIQYSLLDVLEFRREKLSVNKVFLWLILKGEKEPPFSCNLQQGVNCHTGPVPSSPFLWVREGLVIYQPLSR